MGIKIADMDNSIISEYCVFVGCKRVATTTTTHALGMQVSCCEKCVIKYAEYRVREATQTK